MSTASVMKCDVCEATRPAANRYNLPPGWVQIEVVGGGMWVAGDTMHACSKACAARLFYKLADESGGMPARDGNVNPKTGQPYR